MEEKIREYDLKLPSDTNVVTPMNIWKTSIIIANFGRVFTDEELAKHGTPINEKNLFRILSYMRYLGILVEKREKGTVGISRKKYQRWSQSEEKDVQDYFYLLSDKRLDEAKEIFINLIKKHDLYKAIKNDLLNNHRVITEADLRDYFRRKIPKKSAGYYRKGSNFVIRFLSDFCDLMIKDGNKLKLKEFSDKSEIRSDDTVIDEIVTHKEMKTDGKFIINIEGQDGTKFKHIINETSDLEDVEMLINIIKKKLKKM